MMQKYSKIIFVFLLLIVYCFAFQGQRGLFEPDEGRYSAVSLQMIETNDWLYPRTHPQQEHWTKPPLTYWAIAGSILLFGKSEFAVRFPNVLSFLLTIVTCFYLGRVFTPKRPWLVALIFGTFLFPATMCNGATTDFPLTLWETLAVYFFATACWGKNNNKKSVLIYLMWASFGLAFLTKGPPAFLPLISIIVFQIMIRSKKEFLKMHWISGPLLLIMIGGGWYIYVMFQNIGLARYFLWDEIVLRFFTGHHQRHTEWYTFLYIYIPVLIFGSLPWSFFSGKGLVHTIRFFKIDCKEGEGQYAFLALWFFVPLIIFILSKSNLPLYVLPLFVPLAVITAQRIEQQNIHFSKLRYQIVIWCLLIILVRPFMASLPFNKDSSQFAEQIKEIHPNIIKEIVFANARTALGLQFYTGADIKQITFNRSDLQREFNKNEARLWVVLENEASQFRDLIKTYNAEMRELGPIKAWNNYVLFHEISGSI